MTDSESVTVEEHDNAREGVTAPSRRALLGWGGAGLALGAAAAGGAVAAFGGGSDVVPAASTGAAVPFHGEHQAGIATAVQDRLHFATFDVRFIPVQRNLTKNDAINEYIQHVGSAVFAVPPGVRDKDDWWGRTLFT